MEFNYLRKRNSTLEEERRIDKEKWNEYTQKLAYIEIGFFNEVVEALYEAQKQELLTFEVLKSENEKQIKIILVDEDVPEYLEDVLWYMLSIKTISPDFNGENTEIKLKHSPSLQSISNTVNVLDFFKKQAEIGKKIDDLFSQLDKVFEKSKW